MHAYMYIDLSGWRILVIDPAFTGSLKAGASRIPWCGRRESIGGNHFTRSDGEFKENGNWI